MKRGAGEYFVAAARNDPAREALKLTTDLGPDRWGDWPFLLRSALRVMMLGERFHADPHPGNVWLLDDGRLGLLDFGSTGRLDILEQASVADTLIATRRRDPAQLRDAVLEVATVRQPVDERGLGRALARLFMARHLGPGPSRPPRCSSSCSRSS